MRSMSLTRRLALASASAAAVAGLALAGSAGASASAAHPAGVSPTTVYTSNGEAGYYAFGTGFSRVHSQVYIRKYAANLGTADAMGIQLCNNSDGNAIQIGVVPNGTTPQTFSVRYGVGALTGSPDPCVGVGTLSPSDPLATAALGHLPIQENIAMNIKLIGHDRAVVAAQDLTTDTNYWSTVISIPENFYGEAGVGLQDGFTPPLAGPATNELAAMRNSYVVDNHGHEGALGTSPYWTAVQVNSSGTGNPPALITPKSSLSGNTFKIWAATPAS